MKRDDFILYAIFVAGTAFYYGTKNECDVLAANVPNCDVRVFNHF